MLGGHTTAGRVGAKSYMLLVVDDDEDLLEMFSLLFTRADVSCLTARSLAEVKLLEPRLNQVTRAILDVNLGSGQPSGVAVAAWLREKQPSIELVFITGHAPDHPLVVAASGDSRVFAKPIDSQILVDFARGD
jgi:FixJ family two-component response regulator